MVLRSFYEYVYCKEKKTKTLLLSQWKLNIKEVPAIDWPTIAKYQHNTSQHCWVQHVACVWPPCCDVLQHVRCCWLKFEAGQIWANNTQHVATRWPNARNMLCPTMLRYVVLACCDRLAGALTMTQLHFDWPLNFALLREHLTARGAQKVYSQEGTLD